MRCVCVCVCVCACAWIQSVSGGVISIDLNILIPVVFGVMEKVQRGRHQPHLSVNRECVRYEAESCERHGVEPTCHREVTPSTSWPKQRFQTHPV